MVIYVVNGTERVRLGLATGNSTKSFTIPNYLVRGAEHPPVSRRSGGRQPDAHQ